jgi:predicted MFS family arabinose efflux permease
MVIPFMTMYATQKLGFTIVQAGFLMALFGAGAIIGAYFGGKITDAIGFQTMQLVALLGGGCMFITVGFLRTYPSLCIGVLMLSIINESFRPANSTAIAYYSTPVNRTRSYSLNRLAINLGWAFGSAVGGFLAARNYQLLFWVDGLTNISAAIMLMIVLRMPSAQKKSMLEEKKANIQQATSAYKDKPYMWFILLTVMFAFCFFQMFTMLPLFYKRELRLSEDSIGILMALNGLLIALVEMVLVYNIEKKGNALRYICYGVWMVGLSYGIYNIIHGQFFLALLAVIIITFGEMLSMPFMNTFWIGRSSDHNRGQYAALYTMAWGTAQIAAPSIGGYVADNYGFNILWWVVFAVTIITGLGFNKLVTKRPLLQ